MRREIEEGFLSRHYEFLVNESLPFERVPVFLILSREGLVGA